MKTKTILTRLKKCEKGQALAETAITIMFFLLIVLGIIQLSMVMNAKFLVNYAAYCAARAGIVHNGDQGKMKQAAAFALTPLFSYSSDIDKLIIGYGKALIAANLGYYLKVEIVSPDNNRFSSSYNKRFFPELKKYNQGFPELDNNLLVVKVTYDYPLEIPFINRILSPGSKKVKISSMCQMRMQSDNEFQ